jgi:hypothetical protein
VTRSQDLECVQSGCREQLQEPQIAYLSNAHGAFEEVLSQETVRRWMRDAGLWIPRKQRPPRIHQPRNRRACLGELIQIDGSDHAWFEERAPACMLLVYVDDSTSRLMALHFTASESTVSTHNDLFVLGLLMLKELPQYPPAYVLQMQYALQKLMSSFSDEEPRRPIGFTADIDVEPSCR